VSLVATNTIGVSSPYITTVSVVSSPTAISTGTSICVGQTGILNVTTNASSVSWVGGQSGTIAYYSPAVTTVYTFTASTGACQTIGNSTITVGASPSTPSITQTGNVLNSSPSLSYQWYLNGNPISGETNQTYSVTADGWYTVWTNNGSCQSSSAAIYVTLSSVSESFLAFASLEISPNPATDKLNILFRNSYEKLVPFKITNTLGQVVKTGTINEVAGAKSEVRVDGLINGIYTIQLINEGASVSYKFAKY
jgi:hypothetical protein